MALPKPKSARTQTQGHTIKVTNILGRTEHEVTRAELVGFLQQNLAEQRRTDSETTGLIAVGEGGTSAPKEGDMASIQLILQDKKQLKHNKRILLDKAFELRAQVQEACRSNIPVIAVHVPPDSFGAMISNPAWVREDGHEAFKIVAATFPPPSSYATQIREAIIARSSEGHRFVLLMSLREDRIHLIDLE